MKKKRGIFTSNKIGTIKTNPDNLDSLLNFLCEKKGMYESKMKKSASDYIRYRLQNTSGSIVTMYTKGTILIQGKENEDLILEINQYLNNEHTLSNASLVPTLVEKKKNVFVVYGHELDDLQELENFLYKNGYNPRTTNINNMSSGTKHILDAVTEDIKECQFAIVFFTADDLSISFRDLEKCSSIDDLVKYAKPHPRQNVIFELGILWPSLGKENILILEKEGENNQIEILSDLAGITRLRYRNSINELGLSIEKNLKRVKWDE